MRGVDALDFALADSASPLHGLYVCTVCRIISISAQNPPPTTRLEAVEQSQRLHTRRSATFS